MNEVMDIAVGVASEVRRRCPYVDHADLMQEAWEWAARNPTKLAEYMELEERERNAVIATALRNRLRRVAEQNKAAALGYRYRDLGWYSRGQLLDMLPSLFDPSAWTSPPQQDGNGGRQTNPNEGGNWIASLADVADAYRRLSRDDQDLLRMRHGDDITLGLIADQFGVVESTVHERLDRAVSRLHRYLGGDRPVDEPDEISGSRRSVSNAQAQSMTSEGWNG